ncbi:MAG: hypothetical protein IKI28_02075 [Bacteroidales bacterium]|nr:hypothetical protein [Bacteroidales bacterium]
MAKKKRISERRFILLTVGLLIVAGVVRLAYYKAGYMLFYLALVPFIAHRIKHYIVNRKRLSKADGYRKITLFLMLFCLLLNLTKFQRTDFLLLLLLGIDYLILAYHGTPTNQTPTHGDAPTA